jgi:hypothetical protein
MQGGDKELTAGGVLSMNLAIGPVSCNSDTVSSHPGQLIPSFSLIDCYSLVFFLEENASGRWGRILIPQVRLRPTVHACSCIRPTASASQDDQPGSTQNVEIHAIARA